MKRYLAVDTATEACSAALWFDGQVRECFEATEREHTARVLPMIHQLLAEGGTSLTALDGLVCGIGPGSFAGLRIGVGLVKGLALARGLPAVGVSSLAMLAQRALRHAGASGVACAIDARMGEVYVGAYRAGADGLATVAEADRVCVASQAPALPAGSWTAVGSGWGRYGVELGAALAITPVRIDAGALPHAEDALALGVPQLLAGRAGPADALAPAYLRDRVALTLAEQAARRR